MSKDVAIKFSGVSKKYFVSNIFDKGIKGFILNMFRPNYVKKSEYEALANINVEIKKGEFFGLIGQNGAGKSTTLGLIAKVLYPTTGKIEINGRVAPLLELGAGFHDDLTGRENIVVNGVLLGLTKKQVMAKMEEIIEFSGLGKFIDEPMRTYSSGMYMRLGFSVAVNIEPDILLVDEVLAVGDEEFQKKCMDKMQEFKQKGVTIVFVSHALDVAEKVCDRIAYLKQGTVVCVGKPHETIELYRGKKEND